MADQYRMERIERLLREVRYEVILGMMQGDIDESMGFEFIVPVSKSIPSGCVMCSFRTRPIHRTLAPIPLPTLTVIK